MNIIQKSSYKKTIIGKDNYLFLINDGNSELDQHFDPTYMFTLDFEIFKNYLSSNHDFCKSKNINYKFYFIPDKSVICKDKLPFEVNKINRLVELAGLNDVTKGKLLPIHYHKTDSHIASIGAKLFVEEILKDHNVDLDFSTIPYLRKEVKKFMGDLLNDMNWGYQGIDKNDLLEQIENWYNDNIIDISKDLPTEFKFVFSRQTMYFRNNHSLTKKKLLLFRDSSSDFLIPFLSTYYNEIILYWDHKFFNKKLIEWFLPDDVFEIRTERFLVKHRHDAYMPHQVFEEYNPSEEELELCLVKLAYKIPYLFSIEEVKTHFKFISSIVSDIDLTDKVKLPHDFTISGYREKNVDLKMMGDIHLIRHYLIAGIKENRKY